MSIVNSFNRIPKLTKEGYHTVPSMQDIKLSTESELAQVKDFAVYNDYAKIVFEGITDIRDLNLDMIIDIKENEIKVYEDNTLDKPSVGNGLNKPAIITFFNHKTNSNLMIFDNEANKFVPSSDVSFK